MTNDECFNNYVINIILIKINIILSFKYPAIVIYFQNVLHEKQKLYKYKSKKCINIKGLSEYQ